MILSLKLSYSKNMAVAPEQTSTPELTLLKGGKDDSAQKEGRIQRALNILRSLWSRKGRQLPEPQSRGSFDALTPSQVTDINQAREARETNLRNEQARQEAERIRQADEQRSREASGASWQNIDKPASPAPDVPHGLRSRTVLKQEIVVRHEGWDRDRREEAQRVQSLQEQQARDETSRQNEEIGSRWENRDKVTEYPQNAEGQPVRPDIRAVVENSAPANLPETPNEEQKVRDWVRDRNSRAASGQLSGTGTGYEPTAPVRDQSVYAAEDEVAKFKREREARLLEQQAQDQIAQKQQQADKQAREGLGSGWAGIDKAEDPGKGPVIAEGLRDQSVLNQIDRVYAEGVKRDRQEFRAGSSPVNRISTRRGVGRFVSGLLGRNSGRN